MTKQELLSRFYKNHQQFMEFINALPDEKFVQRNNDKWTPGEQLKHVYLTLTPFPKALASKEYILNKFGTSSRPAWDYNTVIENYFKTSRKATAQYVPEEIRAEEKAQIIADLEEILPRIQQLLNGYTEAELDSLVLPHPLLGLMTIRELFYLMTFHATHHLNQTQQNLEKY